MLIYQYFFIRLHVFPPGRGKHCSVLKLLLYLPDYAFKIHFFDSHRHKHTCTRAAPSAAAFCFLTFICKRGLAFTTLHRSVGRQRNGWEKRPAMTQRHWQEVVTPSTKEHTDLFTTRETEKKKETRRKRGPEGMDGRTAVCCTALLCCMRQVVQTEGPRSITACWNLYCTLFCKRLVTAHFLFSCWQFLLRLFTQMLKTHREAARSSGRSRATAKLLRKIRWHPSPVPRPPSLFPLHGSGRYFHPPPSTSSLPSPFFGCGERQTIVVFYDPSVTQPHTYRQHVVRIVYKIKASFVHKIKPPLLNIYLPIRTSKFLSYFFLNDHISGQK